MARASWYFMPVPRVPEQEPCCLPHASTSPLLGRGSRTPCGGLSRCLGQPNGVWRCNCRGDVEHVVGRPAPQGLIACPDVIGAMPTLLGVGTLELPIVVMVSRKNGGGDVLTSLEVMGAGARTLATPLPKRREHERGEIIEDLDDTPRTSGLRASGGLAPALPTIGNTLGRPKSACNESYFVGSGTLALPLLAKTAS